MHDARSRLVDWMGSAGLTAAELSRQIGCDASYLPKIINHGRRPGLAVAHAIERLSASWTDGPIRTEEWLVVDMPSADADAAPPLSTAAEAP